MPTTVRTASFRPLPRLRYLAVLLTAAVLALAAFPGPAGAAPGRLDPSFSGDGLLLAFTGTPAPYSIPRASLALADGKTLVAGDLSDSTFKTFVARFLSDGTLDPAFGTGGITTFALGDFTVGGLTVDATGRILIGGSLLRTGNYDLLVTRLLPTGGPDLSFGGAGLSTIDTGGNEFGGALAVSSAGAITIVGSQVTVAGRRPALGRLLSDGGLDPAWGGTGSLVIPYATDSEATALALEPSGSVTVAGTIGSSGTSRLFFARYLADGTYDPSLTGGILQFDPVPGGIDALTSLVRDPSGRLVSGGYAELPDGRTGLLAVRLLANGAADKAFGTDGVALVPVPGSRGVAQEYVGIGLTTNGRMVLAGSGNGGAHAASTPRDTDSVVAVVGSTGRIDAGFGIGGVQYVDQGAGLTTHALVVTGVRAIVAGALRRTAGSPEEASLAAVLLDDPAPSPTPTPPAGGTAGVGGTAGTGGPPTGTRTAPLLSGVRLLRSRFPVAAKRGSKRATLGTKLTFTASAAGQLEISVLRGDRGVRRGTACVAAKRGRKGKACTRFTAVGKQLVDARAGVNTAAFSGKLSGKTLRAGRYRLSVMLIADGQRSATRLLSAIVLPPK